MWGVPCYVQIHLISKKINTTFLFLEQWIKQMWTLSYQLSISDVNYLDHIPITQFVLCVHLALVNFCFLFCEMPTSGKTFLKLEFLKQWDGSVLKVLPTKPGSLCCTQRTNPHKLSPDFHKCAIAYRLPFLHKHKMNKCNAIVLRF